MIRRIILLLVFSLIASPVWAKNKVVLKVSCTIPRIVNLSNDTEEKLPEDTVVQYEEREIGSKKVMVKTITSK